MHRQFLFHRFLAVSHDYGNGILNDIRRPQVLDRIGFIVQRKGIVSRLGVDFERAVGRFHDAPDNAVYRFFRFSAVKGISQVILIIFIHIRGCGLAGHIFVTFLDVQHRLIQLQHRQIVGAVYGDGDLLRGHAAILVLDVDGKNLGQRLIVLSQFLHGL